MKDTIILFCAIILMSCNSHKRFNTKTTTITKSLDFSEHIKGNVYKIDSINSYCLIYIESNKVKYKIVSRKSKCEKSNIIQNDSIYSFEIEPIFKFLNNGNNAIANYLDVNKCKDYEDYTQICNEPGIQRYTSNNVFGLCIYEPYQK